MPKFILSSMVLAVGVVVFAFSISATSPFDIEFPIPELGNCANKEECRVYCDDLAHKDACLEFAKKHGLVTEEEADLAENHPEAGPGGCTSEKECRAYCENPENFEECTQFAVQHGFLTEEEAQEARSRHQETGPGGCRGAVECRAYCEVPENREECFEYANRRGLISDRDAEVHRRLSEEGGPGGCQTERECRAYCEDPAHLDECLSFGTKHGYVSEEEAVRIRKLGFTEGPGGCKGDECRTYCEDPTHQEECVSWAEEKGLMSAEEARLARKFAGKSGPGGCQGPRECQQFCENPENSETCLAFAEAEGLIPPEELARAKKFLAISREGGPGGCRGVECRDYCANPAHQEECFSFAKNKGLISPEEEKQFEAGMKIEKVMREKGGPGGCTNQRDCMAYCSVPEHAEECVAFGAAHSGLPEEEIQRMLKAFTEGRAGAHGDFAPPEDFRRFEEEARRRFEEFRQLEEHFRGSEFPGASGAFPGGPPISGGFVGPGGCTSPAECIKYCTDHKEECFSFGPPGVLEFLPPEGGIPPGHDFVPPQDFTPPPDEETRLRDRLRDVNVLGCVAKVIGEVRARALLEGTEHFDTVAKEALLRCFEGFTSGGFAPPFPGDFPKPCPLLPTVISCPEGQRKEVAFSSPECGTYYTCVQAESSSDPARVCYEKGGTWDGATCHLPSTTQPSSRAPGIRGFFAKVIDFFFR